jgi:hypothetical protein
MTDDTAITSWAGLAALDSVMGRLADDLRATTDYARQWVCQRDGFEPSAVCLLRPLAALMDVLADGFLALEERALADWASLRAGVGEFSDELQHLDDAVADAFRAVA